MSNSSSQQNSPKSTAAPSRRAVLQALFAISKGWTKPGSGGKGSGGRSGANDGSGPGPNAGANIGAGKRGLAPLPKPGRAGAGPGPKTGPEDDPERGSDASQEARQDSEADAGENLGSGLASPQSPFFAGLDGRDRALAERLYRGVLQNLRVIDLLLERGAELDPKRTREAIKWVLRLAVYQHVFLDSVPPHALVHQSVELGREFGGNRAGGYVNAMLRRLLPVLPEAAEGLPRVLTKLLGRPATPAEHYSVPDKVAKMLEEGYGKAAMSGLLRSFNDPAPRVWLRGNSLKGNVDELRQRLMAEGVDTTSEDGVPSALRLVVGGGAPWTTDCWDRGELTVQDVGAMLATHLLMPPQAARESGKGSDERSAKRFPKRFAKRFAKPSDKGPIEEQGNWPDEAVLDRCAAPGGKTGHLWEAMGGRGRLTAVEQNPERRKILEDAMERLYGKGHAIEVLSPREMMSSNNALRTGGKFKAILLDSPCLGFGLLGRHPEARWDGRAESISRVAGTQRAILEDGARFLAPGGRLLWVTCSPTLLEVEDIVTPFLEAHSDFRLVDLGDRTPNWARPWVQIDEGILRTRPDLAAVDAFAYAMLEKSR